MDQVGYVINYYKPWVCSKNSDILREFNKKHDIKVPKEEEKELVGKLVVLVIKL